MIGLIGSVVESGLAIMPVNLLIVGYKGVSGAVKAK